MTRRGLFGRMLGAVGVLVGSRTAPAKPADDDTLARFLTSLPPAREVERCDAAELARYDGKLPEDILRLWREHGRGAYGDGLITFVDPARWERTLANWLPGGIEGRYVVARSAFGDLFYYRDKGWTEVENRKIRVEDFSRLDPHARSAGVVAWSAPDFFGYLCEPETLDDALRRPLFRAAVRRLGPATGDDGYYFVPALALGGGDGPEDLDKGDLEVHLELLYQLTK